MSAPKGHLLLFCIQAGTVTILRYPSTPPSPKLSTGFAHSYPQRSGATHRLRMLYISYTQVIHAAWLGSACHTPVAISGTCGTFGLPVLTSVYFGQVWVCMWVPFGHTWAYMDRHKLTLVYSSSSTCR